MQDHTAIHLPKIAASSTQFFSQRYYLYSSIIKKKGIQDYRQHDYFHYQHSKKDEIFQRL